MIERADFFFKECGFEKTIGEDESIIYENKELNLTISFITLVKTVGVNGSIFINILPPHIVYVIYIKLLELGWLDERFSKERGAKDINEYE